MTDQNRPQQCINDLLSATNKKEVGVFEAFLRFKQMIHPEENYRYLKKRYDFWAFEVESLNLKALPSDERMKVLQDFVFQQKITLFSQSVSPQILQGLVLQNLAFMTGLQVHFVLLGSHWALKVESEGLPQYISLENGGRILTTQEVLDYINSAGKTKRIEFTDILINYLEILQHYLDPKKAADKILKVYDLLLSLKVGDSKTLLKRASLYQERGQISEALSDLQRYIHFQPHEPHQGRGPTPLD